MAAGEMIADSELEPVVVVLKGVKIGNDIVVVKLKLVDAEVN